MFSTKLLIRPFIMNALLLIKLLSLVTATCSEIHVCSKINLFMQCQIIQHAYSTVTNLSCPMIVLKLYLRPHLRRSTILLKAKKFRFMTFDNHDQILVIAVHLRNRWFPSSTAPTMQPTHARAGITFLMCKFLLVETLPYKVSIQKCCI